MLRFGWQAPAIMRRIMAPLLLGIWCLPAEAQERQFLQGLNVAECRMWRDFLEFGERGVFGEDVLRGADAIAQQFWDASMQCNLLQDSAETAPFSGRVREENKRLIIEFTERLVLTLDYRNVATLVRQSKFLIENANRNAPDPELSVLVTEAQQALRYTEELIATREAVEQSGRDVLSNLRGALVTLTEHHTDDDVTVDSDEWPSNAGFGLALGVELETVPFRRIVFNLRGDDGRSVRKTAQMHYVRFANGASALPGAVPGKSATNIAEVLRDRKVIHCKVKPSMPADCAAKYPVNVLDPSVLRPPGARDSMERLINEAEAINSAIRTVYNSLGRDVQDNIERIEGEQAKHCSNMKDLRERIGEVLKTRPEGSTQVHAYENSNQAAIQDWLGRWAIRARCEAPNDLSPSPSIETDTRPVGGGLQGEELDQIAYAFADSGDIGPDQSDSMAKLSTIQKDLRREVSRRLFEQAELSRAEICGEPLIHTTRPIWWDDSNSDLERVWAIGVAHVRAPGCPSGVVWAPADAEPDGVTGDDRIAEVTPPSKIQPAFQPVDIAPEIDTSNKRSSKIGLEPVVDETFSTPTSIRKDFSDPLGEPIIEAECDKLFLVVSGVATAPTMGCLPDLGQPPDSVFAAMRFSGSGQVRPNDIKRLPEAVRALLPAAGERTCEDLGSAFETLVSDLPEGAPARAALQGEGRVFGEDEDGNIVLCRKRDETWISAPPELSGYLVLSPNKTELVFR
ncbi:hypothetical protein QO034_21505 [Sedimentitalea sp. JM2-8]|uniref:Secreted protein n=1 Tax=Sedimentitalea xiamensis TaxID=3050037 RepID=A0ABT7FKH2_9RHOB|nr:hypothetical protein [Sedimentitalea xiamensis]MDK3075647.1 hypothetical protein [Sedimentitalea xiamensis]